MSTQKSIVERDQFTFLKFAQVLTSNSVLREKEKKKKTKMETVFCIFSFQICKNCIFVIFSTL